MLSRQSIRQTKAAVPIKAFINTIQQVENKLTLLEANEHKEGKQEGII